MRERVDARLGLEGYLHGLRHAMARGEESFMSSEEQSLLEESIRAGQDWLDSNPAATTEEIQMKQKEIEDLCAPIVSRYYGAGTGSPGEEDEAHDEL